MDILITLGICFLVILVTAPMLFLGRKNDAQETGGERSDGPVIPAPAADGSVMGVGGYEDPAEADDVDMAGTIEDDEDIGPHNP